MSSTAKCALLVAIGLCPSALAANPAPELAPLYERLDQEGSRNAVLNQLEIGGRAFALGDHATSREMLDAALDNIESFYSNAENAQKARSLWNEEGRKDFKGEPYERVMAYYYRGLLYLMEKDWGNARASFESGMMQDAFAEEEQNQFDFALMAYLSAWASHREGNVQLKERALKELAALRKGVPAFGNHDTLIIVETGTSPRKLGDGVGHYELVYRRGKGFKEERASLRVGNQGIDMYPMEDIFWQATSRGGRAVDRIIKGKASFRATNAGMGGVLADTASTLQVLQPLSGGLGGLAAGLGAVGSMQMFIASKVNAKADIRYWSALPDAVHVYTLRSKPGQTAQVDFFAKDGSAMPELSQTVTLPNQGGVVWVRARPSPTPPVNTR